jgi:hypothetical protein
LSHLISCLFYLGDDQHFLKITERNHRNQITGTGKLITVQGDVGSVANENSWQKLGTDVRGYDPIPFFYIGILLDIGNTKPSFFIEG